VHAVFIDNSYPTQYTYLLTSQLESQRLYFEEKLARVEQDLNEQVNYSAYMLIQQCLTVHAVLFREFSPTDC